MTHLPTMTNVNLRLVQWQSVLGWVRDKLCRLLLCNTRAGYNPDCTWCPSHGLWWTPCTRRWRWCRSPVCSVAAACKENTGLWLADASQLVPLWSQVVTSQNSWDVVTICFKFQLLHVTFCSESDRLYTLMCEFAPSPALSPCRSSTCVLTHGTQREQNVDGCCGTRSMCVVEIKAHVTWQNRLCFISAQ